MTKHSGYSQYINLHLTVMGGISSFLILAFLAACSNWDRCEPQTVFAPGFNEQRFSKLKIGDARATVFDQLGNPLRQFDEGVVTYLVYSDIGSYTSKWQKAYCQRWVALSNDRIIHLFRRTISTEQNPCLPVGVWQKNSNDVYIAAKGRWADTNK